VAGVEAPVVEPAAAVPSVSQAAVQTPAAPAAVQTPAAPAAPPPSLPTMELAEFIGLSPFEVVEVLGAPDLDRRESAAQVLQYGNGDDCVLHLFLYQSLGGELFRVEYAEVLPRSAQKTAQAACITALLVRAAAG
jgi:hypothetical protein